nr:MAG TPA: hypothetical protein [Caudoviricetes sp.]
MNLTFFTSEAGKDSPSSYFVPKGILYDFIKKSWNCHELWYKEFVFTSAFRCLLIVEFLLTFLLNHFH